MAYIPKRATGHGLHLPEHESPLLDCKAGALHESVSVFESSAKPALFTYETSLQFPMSEYKATTSTSIPQDFVNTANERVYKPRQRIESGNPDFPDLHSSQHWKSTYQATILNTADAMSKPHAPLTPAVNLEQPFNNSKIVNTDLGQSIFKSDFGSVGSNPRRRYNPNATNLPTERTDLTAGTTRGTAFIPGYQGHIPMNSRNPYKARYEQQQGTVNVDKSNICQNFKRNMKGYGGYQFLNPLNDKGSVQISTATTYGEASSVKNWTM